jgi:hypothetical protein
MSAIREAARHHVGGFFVCCAVLDQHASMVGYLINVLAGKGVAAPLAALKIREPARFNCPRFSQRYSAGVLEK